jgi:hypothetical protein
MDRGVPKKRAINPHLAEVGVSDVVMIDVLSVVDGALIRVVFEAVDSPWRQGVWLATDGVLRVNDVESDQLTLWEDTAPGVVEIEIVETDGFLTFYNVWDSGRYPHHESQSATSGMVVSDVGDGRSRYACNDIGYDPTFEKLVFTVEIVPGTS